MAGYSKIAAHMREHHEDAIVHRFSDLNLQNILYLQAEIAGLRHDLRQIEAENESCSDERKDFSLDWYSLAHAHDLPGSAKQWQVFLNLREKLNEYNNAIIQYSQLSAVPGPDPRVLAKFNSWLSRPSLGAVYLTGRDRDIWAQEVDLMALKPPPQSHRLSRSFTDRIIPVYHSIVYSQLVQKTRGLFSSVAAPSKPVAEDIATYDHSRIISTANLIGTITASLLPILAIVVLYFVESMGLRLGLVTLFTAVFSTCLWYMNDGPLVGTLSAVSAFAAVQVVFIGTTSGST